MFTDTTHIYTFTFGEARMPVHADSEKEAREHLALLVADTDKWTLTNVVKK